MYERVRKEMERFFGEDARRIAHALEVTSHALRIQAVEGGDREVVTMASLLHDVGIKPAEKRYKSSAGHYQEKLGPPVAGKITTKEFACLWDADMLVNLREVVPKMGKEKIRAMIDRKFQTGEGKRIARELYLPHLPATGRR